MTKAPAKMLKDLSTSPCRSMIAARRSAKFVHHHERSVRRNARGARIQLPPLQRVCIRKATIDRLDKFSFVHSEPYVASNRPLQRAAMQRPG